MLLTTNQLSPFYEASFCTSQVGRVKVHGLTAGSMVSGEDAGGHAEQLLQRKIQQVSLVWIYSPLKQERS